MNRIFILLFTAFLWVVVGCQQEPNKQEAEQSELQEQVPAPDSAAPAVKKPLSPRINATANIGEAQIQIDYSSPGVRGRAIWGGLVAFDQVWVTGAHKATAITFSKDVRINGQIVPAGTYGFFTIPGRENWTIMFNKNHQQHLADDYNEADDVLRFQVVPEELAEIAESLTYQVDSGVGNKGAISVMWEYKKVSFGVEVL